MCEEACNSCSLQGGGVIRVKLFVFGLGEAAAINMDDIK